MPEKVVIAHLLLTHSALKLKLRIRSRRRISFFARLLLCHNDSWRLRAHLSRSRSAILLSIRTFDEWNRHAGLRLNSGFLAPSRTNAPDPEQPKQESVANAGRPRHNRAGTDSYPTGADMQSLLE
jgi:hypothetical protein